MTVLTDLNQQQSKSTADLLLIMAKAYFVLQTKTLGFHWNVVGDHFIELHHFFEEVYDELSESLDEVSERIRALNFPAPQSVKELSHNAIIHDVNDKLTPFDMIATLLTDYEILIKQVHQILESISHTTDESTKDLLVSHARKFEKRLWMLRSFSTTNQ